MGQMINILIVDDEPFIRQGLQILIDWEEHGFCISKEASNGKEAIELMKDNHFDLIITDIKMPEMNGIELIEYTFNNISKEIHFILLSGYYEFEFAKKAIKYEVVDYILKPIQKDELIHSLEDFRLQYNKKKEENLKKDYANKLVFDSYINQLLNGKADEEGLAYVNKYLMDNTNIRYIIIEAFESDELSEYDSNTTNLLYEALKEILGEHYYHAIYEGKEEQYLIGFIYTKKFADLAGVSEKEYISKLFDEISKLVAKRLILYIGQRVEDISMLSESYKSATIARGLKQVSKVNPIAYYEDMTKEQLSNHNCIIDKDILDNLIKAIEEYDTNIIDEKIEIVYNYLKELVAEPDIINMNMNYLLYNMINLAKELKADVDEEEVFHMIFDNGYKPMSVRGSIKHFKKYILEFSIYLKQLRQYAFGGVLTQIDKEIEEHYMDNLSLKDLSKKYYINSAYLGQIFKKQYGISFKDYLNNYRIERAAELLIRVDVKIYEIAEAVGFNSTDYFISKFVEVKGITPLQYRKQYVNTP